MRIFRLLFAGLDHFVGRFLLITLVGFVDGAVTFFVPVLLAEFTATNFSPAALWRMIPLLVLLLFASHGLQWILRKFGEAFGPEFSMHLRQRYFRALESMSLKRLSSYHSGYLLSIIGAVADGLGAMAVEVFWGFARSAANIGLFFYFLSRQSGPLTAGNFLILVAFVFLSAFFSRRMVPITAALNKQRAKMVARYADFAANVPTVKRLGIQKFAEARIEEISRETFEIVTQHQNFHARRWFSLHSLFSLAMILTMSILLARIGEGKVTSSILILFVAAFTAVRMNAERLSENFRAILELDTYVDTLLEVLEPEKQTPGIIKPERWSELRFNNIEFQHPNSSIVVRIPEFKIQKGERIGISGPSGEGKTTFLHLLAALLEPRSGERFVDAGEYGTLAESFFQERVAVVSQEAELFHMSVRDNLLLGRTMPDEKLKQLLVELGLGDWLASVEGGLDSIIGEKGVTVSQGQKQRLNLLRGILLEREILLLDEPTSHLDGENRDKVLQFIDRHCAGKTLVIVSHQPETLSRCATLYRMDGNVLRS